MMEKVYRIKIDIESTDEADIARFLHWIAEDVEEGRLKNIQMARGGIAQGTVKYTTEERCEHCHGTGEVATDEDDGEGHTMRGVGTQKCICQ